MSPRLVHVQAELPIRTPRGAKAISQRSRWVAETRFDRTAWGAASSNHTISTIQSFQTADFHAGSKEAVSVGIFAGIVPLFRSLVTLAVSQADFSLPSLQQKIPFPAAEFGAANDRRLENLAFREAELPFRADSGITEDSARGLRTAGSILREHREVVRLRCRAANDPRPRPGRDPVRGTRARSSC
jgi:hypothetical protein